MADHGTTPHEAASVGSQSIAGMPVLKGLSVSFGLLSCKLSGSRTSALDWQEPSTTQSRR